MTRNTGLLGKWSLTGAGGLYLERGWGGGGGGAQSHGQIVGKRKIYIKGRFGVNFH